MEFAKNLSGTQKLYDVSKASNRKLQCITNAAPSQTGAEKFFTQRGPSGAVRLAIFHYVRVCNLLSE